MQGQYSVNLWEIWTSSDMTKHNLILHLYFSISFGLLNDNLILFCGKGLYLSLMLGTKFFIQIFLTILLFPKLSSNYCIAILSICC